MDTVHGPTCEQQVAAADDGAVVGHWGNNGWKGDAQLRQTPLRVHSTDKGRDGALPSTKDPAQLHTQVSKGGGGVRTNTGPPTAQVCKCTKLNSPCVKV